MADLDFRLASANTHKAEELNNLLASSGIDILPASKKVEVLEDGESFSANALKKAESYYQREKCPVLSDDSGLVVEALPDELGIHSARFGGPNLSDPDRANLLLERLRDNTHRQAHFVCVLCFYLNPGEIFFFEGRLNGKIAYEYLGSAGFGYDPVFIPESPESQDKTLAQIPEWKEQNSHRAQACKWARQFFKSS